MKALSIRQPWAWAILHAGKRVENRQWERAPRRRGPILIHASKSMTREEYEDGLLFMDFALRTGEAHAADFAKPLPPRFADLTRGAIVGRANLVAAGFGEARVSDRWATGPLHIILRDVEALGSPVPYKGALGFFDVPDALLAGATWTKVDP